MTARTLTLRPQTTADLLFLLGLFASTREAELVHLPLDDEGKRQFVEQQFRMQGAQYRAAWPGASFGIVELDEMPVGRLVIDRCGAAIRIIDIALLPDARGQGVGTRLLTGVQDESTHTKQPLQLSVRATNRARRLYERLGFIVTGDDGFTLNYVWTPPRGPDG